jgi:phosphate transport system substrate-binding protein
MRFRILGLLLAVFSVTMASCSDAKRGGIHLDGAGATFPEPLYQKWFEDYHTAHPEVKIAYNGVGSGAGIQLFTGALVDFGASDAAMTDEQIRQVENGGVQLVPMTAGMVVLAYNLPGVSQPLKLSREACAEIWLGKLTYWNDQKLKAANPGVTLPATEIKVIHRLGASGTTFVFTQHLSAISAEWKQKVAQGLTVDWPTGTGAKGKDGIVSFIQQTPGAIGYLDFGTAERNKLPVASLENKAGEYVEPSLDSCQAALANAALPENLRVSIPDPEGKSSYPIVTFTWILAHAKYDDPKTAAAVKDVLTYGLTDGQKECAPLGYIPLPEGVRQAVLKAVNRIGS